MRDASQRRVDAAAGPRAWAESPTGGSSRRTIVARASASWIRVNAVTLPMSAISAAATYAAWNAAKLSPPTLATTVERMATPSASDVCGRLGRRDDPDRFNERGQAGADG